MSWSSFSYFVVLILSVIIGDLLCADVTNNGKTFGNPWQSQNSRAVTDSGVRFIQNNNVTTPWPLLGQRPPNNFSNNNNQPLWIRPNNGTLWVRNTPSSSISKQRPNAGGNTRVNQGNPSTDFINREKGGNQNSDSNINNQNRHSISDVSNGMFDKFPISTNKNAMPSVLPAGSMAGNREDDAIPYSYNYNENYGDVDDDELREFSEEIYMKDVNNAAKYVQTNLQGSTTSRSTRDEAPSSLLSINRAAFSIPSVAKVLQLYNNYILESNQNEVHTAQEKLEENDLLDTILSTPVMEHTRNFLIKKGKIGKDPKEFRNVLKEIWFNMYSRGKGHIGSSGFEHVFLAEIKHNQVSGLHNWIYFNDEESKRNANYLGFMKKLDLGNKGMILKYHFTFHNVDKPVGSMFIGTSPELEMALYSTCFILRANRICPLKMNGNRFIIRTFSFRYRGKNMIGSAFPEI